MGSEVAAAAVAHQHAQPAAAVIAVTATAAAACAAAGLLAATCQPPLYLLLLRLCSLLPQPCSYDNDNQLHQNICRKVSAIVKGNTQRNAQRTAVWSLYSSA
jgi:hypothetical protein